MNMLHRPNQKKKSVIANCPKITKPITSSWLGGLGYIHQQPIFNRLKSV
jgi:hypothetical protein